MGVSTTYRIKLSMWILIYWHTLRLGRLWQNMRGFDHATILSPSFHGLCKERLAQWPPICIELFREGLSEKVHATIPKGIVGSFECSVLQRNLKQWPGGHGHMFASAKGKQKKYVRQLQSSGTVYWWYPILPFGIVACTFFPTTFLEIAVWNTMKKPGGECFQRNWVGGVRHVSWNPSPISYQNLWFSLPYFRPNQKFDTLFQIWSPGARRVNA